MERAAVHLTERACGTTFASWAGIAPLPAGTLLEAVQHLAAWLTAHPAYGQTVKEMGGPVPPDSSQGLSHVHGTACPAQEQIVKERGGPGLPDCSQGLSQVRALPLGQTAEEKGGPVPP
eukprot:1160795-Pelagomonas_calceolata.AAC.2